MFVLFWQATHARELADKLFSFLITDSISHAKSCLFNVSIHIDLYFSEAKTCRQNIL